jgi:hypothetical protein
LFITTLLGSWCTPRAGTAYRKERITDAEVAVPDPTTAAPGSEALLRSFPSEQMEAYPVSKAVGNVKNKGSKLIEPLRA